MSLIKGRIFAWIYRDRFWFPIEVKGHNGGHL